MVADDADEARLASTMPGPSRVVIAKLKFQAARWDDPGQHYTDARMSDPIAVSRPGHTGTPRFIDKLECRRTGRVSADTST